MSKNQTTTTIKIKTITDLKEREEELKNYILKRTKLLNEASDFKKNNSLTYKNNDELYGKMLKSAEEYKQKILAIQKAKEEAPTKIKEAILKAELIALDAQLSEKQKLQKASIDKEKEIQEKALVDKIILLAQYKQATDKSKAEEILSQIQLNDIKTNLEVKAEQDKQAKIKTEIENLNTAKVALLNQDLTNSEENIFQKFKLREAGLKAELAAYEDNDGKIKEIEKRRQKAHKEHYDALIKDVSTYLSKTKEAYSAISDAIFALKEWEIAEDQENHERYLKNMETEGKTEEERNTERSKQEAERNAKTLKAKRAKADRDKYFAVFETTINTASAIVKMLADPGGFAGIALSIAAGITGVAQIAKIMATPLPKKARGGLIGGKPHSLGGTLIEAEAGEAVINKRSTSMFAPILSAINESGGGVPFAAPLSDGGFAHRDYQRRNQAGLSETQMEDAMTRAITKQQIFVAIEDINKGQKQYAQTTDISTF